MTEEETLERMSHGSESNRISQRKIVTVDQVNIPVYRCISLIPLYPSRACSS